MGVFHATIEYLDSRGPSWYLIGWRGGELAIGNNDIQRGFKKALHRGKEKNRPTRLSWCPFWG